MLDNGIDNTNASRSASAPDARDRQSHPQDHQRDREAERPAHLTAEEARQGRIVLDTPFRRALFFGGLAGIVFVMLVTAIIA